MATEVLHAPARCTTWEYEWSLPAKLEEILRRSGVSAMVTPGEYVAVKLHLGSEGAFRTIRPVFVRKVVEAIRSAGGIPFVTDTTRIPGLEYLEVAAANGYSHLTCGAPIIMADGIFGRDVVRVPLGEGAPVAEMGVASAIYHAGAMVVLTHCKGHIGPGYGGAIKNVAFGGVGRRTQDDGVNRGHLHSVENLPPAWNPRLCTFCERCAAVCPINAIEIEKTVSLKVNEGVCDRCGRCVRICHEEGGALSMPISEEVFARGMVEAARAVLSTFAAGKVLYLNFLQELQPECDCMPVADVPVMQDQGILAGLDIVAVETATLDLLDAAPPLPQSKAEDAGIGEAGDVLGRINQRRTRLPLEYAAALGLGESAHRLVTIHSKRRSKVGKPPREHRR